MPVSAGRAKNNKNFPIDREGSLIGILQDTFAGVVLKKYISHRWNPLPTIELITSVGAKIVRKREPLFPENGPPPGNRVRPRPRHSQRVQHINQLSEPSVIT